MTYPYEKLRGHIEVLSGFAFKSADFCDHGIPVIKIKNITPPFVSLEDLSYVSTELANEQEKYQLKYGDVLIALTGSHINQMASVVGRVARVKYNTPSLLNQRVGKIIVCSADTDLDYVYYYLSQDDVKIKLASKAGGAANQANISPSDIKDLIVPFPKLETQRRIADILSAYDDLIENNQKQINLLEEAAQRLYKEWFVDLRFPGCEHTCIIDDVPEGWERNRADKFYGITIGKTPPRAEEQWFTTDASETPWLSIADMKESTVFSDVTSERLTNDAIKRFNIVTVPPNTVVLSFKLTIGRVLISSESICTNEAIAHFHIDIPYHREYVYCYLKNFSYGTLGSTSSISTALNSKIVKSMPFIMPRGEILLRFSEQVKPIFDMIHSKILQNKELKQARDRLLPKLMNGEMEV